MRKFITNHKKTFIIITSIIVVLILGSISLFTFSKVTTKTPKAEVNETVVGSAIQELLTDNVLGSYMSTPADKEWWNTISRFAPSYELDKIDFNSLPTKPTMLGWSLSGSEQQIPSTDAGLNTVYLAFDTEEQALATVDYLYNIDGRKYEVFSAKNITAIMPTWTYSDVDYQIEQFNQSTVKATRTTQQGNWVINFAELQKIIMKSDNTLYDEIFSAALENLGVIFNETSNTAYWEGKSTDGLNWEGKTSVKGLWDKQNINYDQLKVELEKGSIAILPDGREVSQDELKKIAEESPNGEFIYLYEPGTATVLEYLVIQDNEKATGTIRNKEGVYSTPEPLVEKDYVSITVKPNIWLSYSRGELEAYPKVGFDEAEIRLFNNSDRIDIILTPLEAFNPDDLEEIVVPETVETPENSEETP